MACDDNLGPMDWSAAPDTVTLFSLSRPEHMNLPSAFDFPSRLARVVETVGATGNWDIAVTESDGTLEFAPSGVFEGMDTIPGVAVVEASSFEEVTAAPANRDSFANLEPVPAVEGRLYAVRSRRVPDFLGRTCVKYAKVEVLETDTVEGTVTFRYAVNPNCNDRALVPPQ